MNIAAYILQIQTHLLRTHVRVLDWFEEDANLKSYRPADQGWTVLEILEHIALTSHFLLILIEKGSKKALKSQEENALQEALQTFHYDLGKMDEIGIHKSFAWVRPEHMEPTGKKSELEIQQQLIAQVNECLTFLAKLAQGEGLLYKTTMTVNDLGKINVYEYVYFLSKHAERHLQQLEENKGEYEQLFSKVN
ncbi:MAG: DinB family protein [Bacteroidia bacterium]|nr:DinB family protein [Bacteroidia bacterium]